MQHVRKRLDVHQTMFNGNIQQSAERKTLITGRQKIRFLCELVIECRTNAGTVFMDDIRRRPVTGNVIGQTAADWIDAKSEEAIEVGIKTFEPESAAVKQVPVEGFQMPQIKNDAMTLRDGPVIKGIDTYQAKKRIALPARRFQ